MSHSVSAIGNVVTVRLDGKTALLDAAQDIRNAIDKQTSPSILILDLTLSGPIDQQFKSMIYRSIQHHHVARVGVCGISNPEVAQDVQDLVPILQRTRDVKAEETEADLYVSFGLAAPQAQERKLTGMLSRLKKSPA